MEGSVTLRFFAGAARAVGTRERAVDVAGPTPLGDLVEALEVDPEGRRVLRLCTWLVDTRPAERDEVVPPGAIVDALPPFAGG